jgi:hypothetical protein
MCVRAANLSMGAFGADHVLFDDARAHASASVVAVRLLRRSCAGSVFGAGLRVVPFKQPAFSLHRASDLLDMSSSHSNDSTRRRHWAAATHPGPCCLPTPPGRSQNTNTPIFPQLFAIHVLYYSSLHKRRRRTSQITICSVNAALRACHALPSSSQPVDSGLGWSHTQVHSMQPRGPYA